MRVELAASRVERLAEDRERLVQLGAHPRALRSLAREQERHLASPDRALDHAAAGSPRDSAPSPASSASRSGPTTAARRSSWERAVASEYAMSTGASSGCAST